MRTWWAYASRRGLRDVPRLANWLSGRFTSYEELVGFLDANGTLAPREGDEEQLVRKAFGVAYPPPPPITHSEDVSEESLPTDEEPIVEIDEHVEDPPVEWDDDEIMEGSSASLAKSEIDGLLVDGRGYLVADKNQQPDEGDDSDDEE